MLHDNDLRASSEELRHTADEEHRSNVDNADDNANTEVGSDTVAVSVSLEEAIAEEGEAAKPRPPGLGIRRMQSAIANSLEDQDFSVASPDSKETDGLVITGREIYNDRRDGPGNVYAERFGYFFEIPNSHLSPESPSVPSPHPN